VGEVEIRPLRHSEIDRFVGLTHYAFDGRTPQQRAVDFGRRITPERDVLVAVEDGVIISQVLIYEFVIWINGVRYPTGGLANVVTAPEKSRQGYASKLLRATLAWMSDELGQSLSTLYPTVYPVYRKLGWSLADDSWRITGPPMAFRPNAALPEDPGSRLVRRLATSEDINVLAPMYEQFVRDRSSYLDRPRWYWEDIVLRSQGDDPRWLGFWYGSDGVLSGYIVYTLERAGEWQLDVYEIVALRPEVYHDILTFLTAHNLLNKVVIGVGRDVPWRSLVSNPQAIVVEAHDHSNQMLRIVNFPRAISLHDANNVGHLPAVTLKVVDDNAPWNAGTWRLQPSERQWSAERIDEPNPEATADISTLSSLFSGFITVTDAVKSGLLSVAVAARPTLEALFHTSYPPTSRDHF